LLVRPNLQFIVSEGGNPSNASIFVLGLKTSITF
jgi:carbohydrate-selective porin OprB